MTDSSVNLPRSKSLYYKTPPQTVSTPYNNSPTPPIITVNKSDTQDTAMQISSSDDYTIQQRKHSIPENISLPPIPPPKSESTGFLSSLLSAAANKISSGTSSVEDSPKKKEHTFSSKLDTWLKTKSDNPITPDGDQLSLNEATKPNDLSSIISAQNVQFEPVRESPLNTLGHGELSLNDFDQLQQEFDTPPRHNSTNGYAKRELSPDVTGRLSNGTDIKRIHRKSITSQNKNISSLSGLPESSSIVAQGRRRALSLDSVYSDPNKTKSLIETQSNIIEDFESDDISVSGQEEIDNIIDSSKKIKHASKKRNKEFHQVFKKLPPAEKLIEDFSCAVSKDILVQGKMYLSDHYICFNSNILGWVTNVMIPLQEVIQIEKKSTAGLFPNGMIIRTLHHKYVFATFLSRDSTFALITNVWHRVLLENTDVDTRKIARRNRADTRASNLSHLVSSYEDSEVLDEYLNDEGELDGSIELRSDSGGDEVLALEDVNKEDEDLGLEPKADTTMTTAAPSDSKMFKGLPIVGPHTHAPTESNYTKSPSDVFITEEIFKVPPGVVYLLLFGSDTSKLITILKDQKNIEINESAITSLDKQNKERNYTYVKPLSAPIGPKQTKCIISDRLIEYNPEKCYEVEQTTQTPDVPSGNSFKIKTRFFLTWAENNHCKMCVVTNIEWSGKSWIKSAIEKGSIDGQKESMKIMTESLNLMISQGDKKTSKRKMTRGRKGTVVKREKPEEEKDTAEVEIKEKSIGEKFTDLAESIGKLVPIPYLSSGIVGIMMILFGVMIIVSVFNRIGGSGSRQYNVVEYIPSTGYTGRMKINDREYMIISSVNTNLNNEDNIRQQEVSIWNWLNERSEGKIKVASQDEGFKEKLHTKYSDEELKELVRLTQLKLDQLAKELNSQRNG